MREIKFKAWDNVLKEFNYEIEIDSFGGVEQYKNTGSSLYPIYGTDESGAPVANKRFTICQYTHCKDRNGKEIYEGDIIKFDKKATGWHDNIFQVNWHDYDSWCFFSGGGSRDNEFRTVIGNIFENPELLKQ